MILLGVVAIAASLLWMVSAKGSPLRRILSWLSAALALAATAIGAAMIALVFAAGLGGIIVWAIEAFVLVVIVTAIRSQVTASGKATDVNVGNGDQAHFGTETRKPARLAR